MKKYFLWDTDDYRLFEYDSLDALKEGIKNELETYPGVSEVARDFKVIIGDVYTVNAEWVSKTRGFKYKYELTKVPAKEEELSEIELIEVK
jgi:hypothetical protein